MSFLVRDAAPEDASAWHAINVDVATDDPPTTFVDLAELSDAATLAKRFADAPRDLVWHLVAVEHGTVVGTLGAKRGDRKATRHVAEVGLSVARAHRGRGVGRALMLALEERARAHGVRKLALATFAHNERAQRLFGSMGYREEGRQRAQFVVRDREIDTILMAKWIS